MKTKTCKTCQQTKRLTEFYYGDASCRSCTSEYHKQLAKREFTEKYCPRCQHTKPRDQWINWKGPYCRPCNAAYDRERRLARAATREPRRPKRKSLEELRTKAREREKRYRQSEKGKTTKASYQRSVNGKLVQRFAQRIARMKRPERHAARMAVQLAVLSGQLQKPKACAKCGTATPKLEAHHHSGYELAHWFDVHWLCRTCHLGQHATS